MDQRIYLCLAHMSETGKEQMYIKEAFDTNWVVPLGPNVNGFEKDLEEFVGEGKHVVALSAGTAAVHLALLACGVKPGDEVLVQSFTFCASSHPITYLGATPVFVDSEVDTWNMNPVLLEKAIKDRTEKTGKTPKAIVPVALYGMPYKVDEIMAVAGYNYRMSNICAGIGRGQMTVADAHVAHHKHTCDLYRELLKDVKGITLHENPSGRFDSNYWLNTIVLDPLLRVKQRYKVLLVVRVA